MGELVRRGAKGPDLPQGDLRRVALPDPDFSQFYSTRPTGPLRSSAPDRPLRVLSRLDRLDRLFRGGGRRPDLANGHAYPALGGTSGASQPAWPTGSGATVVDGTLTWQEHSPNDCYSSLSGLTVTFTVPVSDAGEGVYKVFATWIERRRRHREGGLDHHRALRRRRRSLDRQLAVAADDPLPGPGGRLGGERRDASTSPATTSPATGATWGRPTLCRGSGRSSSPTPTPTACPTPVEARVPLPTPSTTAPRPGLRLPDEPRRSSSWASTPAAPTPTAAGTTTARSGTTAESAQSVRRPTSRSPSTEGRRELDHRLGRRAGQNAQIDGWYHVYRNSTPFFGPAQGGRAAPRRHDELRRHRPRLRPGLLLQGLERGARRPRRRWWRRSSRLRAGGGTAVSVYGSDFVAGATVTFGGFAATNVVVVNAKPHHLQRSRPAPPPERPTSVVTLNGQDGARTAGFTYP